MASLRSARSLSPLSPASLAVVAASAALLLSACTADPADSAGEESEVATATEAAEPTAEETSEAAEEPSDPEPAALSDICDLVTAEEVTSIIGEAIVATDYTYGSRTDDTGGQCIWTTNPDGDVFGPGASQLELVVWVPGSIFPPPDDAPAAGTAGTAPTDAGAYFTSDERVFWLRLTGPAYTDAAAVSATQALAATVDSRV